MHQVYCVRCPPGGPSQPGASPTPSAAVVGRAKNILKYLKDFENVQFMHFLCDVLQPLAHLSLAFQAYKLTPGEFCSCSCRQRRLITIYECCLQDRASPVKEPIIRFVLKVRHYSITRCAVRHSWSWPSNPGMLNATSSTARQCRESSRASNYL